MDNPISLINSKAHELTKDDLNWIVPELMKHFSGRINYLSTYTYGSEQGLALAAFKEHSRETIISGVETFLFKNQYWRTGRSIEPYLLVCLSKLADKLKDIDFVKKVILPVCPACKIEGNREFLVYEGKLLRCQACTRELERLQEIKHRSSREEFQYRIHTVYSLHSRKGRRCPGCGRFIPESYINDIRVSCPFDNCDWFGVESELEPMNHPLGQNSNSVISLNFPIVFDRKTAEMQDLFDAKEINPDIILEQEEKYQKELSIVQSVIETQKSRLSGKSIKKYLMYQAFEDLLDQDPAAMISYLTRKKTLGERPIQSAIFQQYVKLIENRIPFSISTDEGEIEIYSLLDPALDLFLGMSEFQGYVKDSGIIDNNTREIFVGSKCNGPCFIGWLCGIQDEKGNSLLNEVDYYSFSNIKMKPNVAPGTVVNITHFRMPPHYEMYSLVNFQRCRKRIVTSISKRLNR